MSKPEKGDTVGLMKRMAGGDPQQVAEAVARAQAAWDSHQQVYVLRLATLSPLGEDTVNQYVAGVAATGWQLHTMTGLMNTIGPNTEVLYVAFTRPS